MRLNTSTPGTPRAANSRAAFQRTSSNSSLSRLPRSNSAFTVHGNKQAQSTPPEEQQKNTKAKSFADIKSRGLKAVGPTLSALAAATQLAIGLSTENEQLSDDSAAPAHVRFSMLNGIKLGATSISEADDSSRGSGGRIDSQPRPHVPLSAAQLSKSPLSNTPFTCSKAPDFAESRSRLTLAERAAAATQRNQ